VPREQSDSELWHEFLTAQVPGLRFGRWAFGHLPSSPRCKLCTAPFGSPGNVLMRLFGGGPSPLNRRICKWCIGKVLEHPGGTELVITVLLADVRGSTSLAERMPADDFSRLIARFYGVAARVIDRWDGIVDKFVGDEVVALFIPGFAGEDHAADAVGAARELLRETGHDGGQAPWIPVGVGVHTGLSFVGSVGEGDARDFTALGDTVNTAARLTSVAGPGEVLVSEATVSAAELDTSRVERRTLALRGREQTVEAWVLTS
jgi:adenylate cyclase